MRRRPAPEAPATEANPDLLDSSGPGRPAITAAPAYPLGGGSGRLLVGHFDSDQPAVDDPGKKEIGLPSHSAGASGWKAGTM
jgi:hypothetical protein